MFKSATQPLCRYSGKPIPKHTTTVYFGNGPLGTCVREFPRSLAEAQRHVNGKIISVRWSRVADHWSQSEPDHDYIRWAGVWDGESYVDEFFAKQPDAVRFAYLMAKNGHCTKAYNNAVKEADHAA